MPQAGGPETTTGPFISHLCAELEALKAAGLCKAERVITSVESAEIDPLSGEPADAYRAELAAACVRNGIDIVAPPPDRVRS